MKTYRDNGAIGALLDEYEKAIRELNEVIHGINDHELKSVIDHETKDPDCKSIQTILTHVVRAGYGYVIAIRKHLGEKAGYVKGVSFDSSSEYIAALNSMFEFNEKLFTDNPNLEIEQKENRKKITTRWGQQYDVEQLFEHAIVHILRHRRQIERFLLKVRNQGTN